MTGPLETRQGHDVAAAALRTVARCSNGGELQQPCIAIARTAYRRLPLECPCVVCVCVCVCGPQAQGRTRRRTKGLTRCRLGLALSQSERKLESEESSSASATVVAVGARPVGSWTYVYVYDLAGQVVRQITRRTLPLHWSLSLSLTVWFGCGGTGERGPALGVSKAGEPWTVERRTWNLENPNPQARLTLTSTSTVPYRTAPDAVSTVYSAAQC